MGPGIPFEDVPPDEKIAILAAAHRYGAARTGSEVAEVARDWSCVECCGLFTMEDLLVVNGEPQCPLCRAWGWDLVHPHPAGSG